jgi:8-oxo-dGTP pyrophosphatase MutT (NUDIX family)
MAGTDGRNEGAQGGDQPPKRRRRRRRRRPNGGQTPRHGAAAAQTDPKPADAATAAQKPKTGDAAQAPRGGGTAKRRGGRGRSRSKKPASAKHAKGGSGRGSRPKPTKIPTTREVSAGGVVYRHADDGAIEVVLASRRTRRGQLAWGLAKGGIEIGESKEDAAIREVREETGLTADIEADLGDTKYMYVWDDIRIRKTVHFFLMRHTGGDVDDRDDEMEEIRWFPLERAIKRAAYRGERDMLVKASELLR